MTNKIKVFFILSLFISLFSSSAEAISIKEINREFLVPKYRNLSIFSNRAISHSDIYDNKKAKILVVFASWCPSCKGYIKELNKVKEKSNQDILGVSVSDNPILVRELFNEHGSPFSLVSLDKQGKTLLKNSKFRAIPQTFLIDKNGAIRYIFLGDLDEEDWFEDLMPKFNELSRE
jgi:cytochrome c biogenesis protein CcmG/thiol:disulfide interchange protein DsbE